MSRHQSRLILSAAACAGIAAPVFSGETAIASSNRFWELIAMPETTSVVVGIVGLAAALLTRLSWVRKWRLERAAQCLASGVRETYEEYVRVIKESREDGKLTAEEREEARRMAIAKAKAFALADGFDLLKAYAEEYLPVLVERLVGSQKAAGLGVEALDAGIRTPGE